RRNEGVNVCGQRVRAEHRIDDDLERDRIEQRDRARDDPEREQAGEVEPVGPRLPQQPPVQCEVTHARRGSLNRATACRIVAMAAMHCSMMCRTGRTAPTPSMWPASVASAR